MSTQIGQATTQAAMEVESSASTASSSTSILSRAGFHTTEIEPDRIARSLPKKSPNAEPKAINLLAVYDVVKRPADYILEGVRPLVEIASRRPVAISFDPSVLKRPLDRAWGDLKGVTAVVISTI